MVENKEYKKGDDIFHELEGEELFYALAGSTIENSNSLKMLESALNSCFGNMFLRC